MFLILSAILTAAIHSKSSFNGSSKIFAPSTIHEPIGLFSIREAMYLPLTGNILPIRTYVVVASYN